ncbi:MAG: DMT family transporter [Pseudomonadota bacterium]
MTGPHRQRLPALRGGAFALLSAVLFGISTPLVQRAGEGLGPFATAALLYAGAAMAGALLRQPIAKEAQLQRSDFARITLMALFGAVIGPVALAWGLQHTSGASASLMLALEALFTAVLARLLYQEVMDRRVWTAMTLLLLGGIVLVIDRGLGGSTQMPGLLAVLAATAAWGVDNTLSRGVADRDPGQGVLSKSALGAAAAGAIAWLAGESLPPATQALALFAIGGAGYGVSLRLYLLAQREFGAARAGSVFAFAPFIGAAVAVGLGERGLTWGMAAGAALMLAGVLVHLLERHAHRHTHEAMTHEHAHTHDDGHHDHAHDESHTGPVTGSHSHVHRHAPTDHSHPHVPDIHHAHKH